jgi:hypothetical protein
MPTEARRLEIVIARKAKADRSKEIVIARKAKPIKARRLPWTKAKAAEAVIAGR